MKKLIKITVILSSLFIFSSCNNMEWFKTSIKTEELSTSEQYLGVFFRIITVDSCEYILHGSDSRTMTHRGRCKYCKLRHDKELRYYLNKNNNR